MKANTTLVNTHTKPLSPSELLALEVIALDDDNPITCDDDWAGATLKVGKKVVGKTRGKQKSPLKSPITLRLDSEIVEYFKKDGKGYQTRINNALKQYILANS